MVKTVDIKIAFLATISLFLALFLGCDHADAQPEKLAHSTQDQKAKGQKDNNKQKKAKQKKKKKSAVKQKPVLDTLAPTSVIVRVNGEAITKGEFITWERARTRAYAMSKGWKLNIKNDETKRFHAQSRTRALDELLKHKLIGQYAREQGIEPDEKELARQEKMFLREVKKPKAALAEVLASLGAQEGEMIRQFRIRGDALTMAVLSRTTSNDLYHVSAQEFTNRVEFVDKWNKEADNSNAVVRARAEQAKKEILAGAYFADVAKKYASFAPEQGEEWETFHLDEFEGDDLLGQWLAQHDTGDISDPLDLDDGISIVGIKAKYVSDVSESNKPPVYAYDVVRCPFHAYEKLEDFDGVRKAIEEDIIATRRQVAIQKLRESLLSKAKVEFPYGDNLFYPPEKKKKAKPNKPKAASAKTAAPETKAAPEKKVETETKSGQEGQALPETKVGPEKKADAEKKANLPQ